MTNTTRDIASFTHVQIDMIKYDSGGRVLGVYVLVEDYDYRAKYWVTSFLIEPVFCKFKRMEIPEGLTLNASHYIPFVHLDYCLDALEQAKEGGGGGSVQIYPSSQSFYEVS